VSDSHHEHAGHDHSAHDHSHEGHDGHAHASAATPTRRLAWALSLTLGFMVVEVVAGAWTHSLALLSDAGHMLTDAGALAIALFAQRLASRPRDRRRTYGYRRAEVLAALGNGVVLGVSSVLIIIEAVRRLSQPPEVQGVLMLAVATVGLGFNLVSAKILLGGGATNANIRAAAAHVMADAAGSVAAMLAGLLVWLLHWTVADPVLSIAISVLILWSAWKLVRQSLAVLMEAAPPGLDLVALERTIAAVPGVAGQHDLHAWSISDGQAVVTVHVTLTPGSHGTEVCRAVASAIAAQHHIEHVTVQPEPPQPALVSLRVP